MDASCPVTANGRRIDDRVIFSMPTQLTRDPMQLHLINIPAKGVDWPRTERYAESVRAAAMRRPAATRISGRSATRSRRSSTRSPKIADARARLATAERARQKLADWPAAHYGYRNAEVREALNVLDEVIAQLRVAVGITRFDLSLSANAPLAEPPPPPLPPPTDAELVEQFAAAASIADSPPERVSLLQTVLPLDRSRRRCDARGVGGPHAPHRHRRARPRAQDRTGVRRAAERARSKRRRASPRAARPPTSSGYATGSKRRTSDWAASGPATSRRLLATIDLQAASAVTTREKRKIWDRRAPHYRRYRRSTNGAFKVFDDAAQALEQVRAMNGPPVNDARLTGQTAEHRQPQLHRR